MNEVNVNQRWRRVQIAVSNHEAELIRDLAERLQSSEGAVLRLGAARLAETVTEEDIKRLRGENEKREG